MGGEVMSDRVFERYMEEYYASVPGMSSAFAARVCAALMRIQSGAGWHGNLAEIGAFEGRFLIALALTLQRGEKALAIDLFDWPDIHVNVRLLERLRTFGLIERVDIICADSRALTPDMIAAGRYGQKLRFFHIDGDHQAQSLAQDMALALASMEPWGLVCLDDMLSPAYPELACTVADVLRMHSEWMVFCVIDREDISASSKFLLCRREYVQYYTDGLVRAFKPNVWQMRAQFSAYQALVLAPKPRLMRFGPGGTVEAIH
ncbi:hypothetical protein NB706_000019 [Xanthomonas sacchari]|nr:hypothetical protein [Xanthomonas sacchari]